MGENPAVKQQIAPTSWTTNVPLELKHQRHSQQSPVYHMCYVYESIFLYACKLACQIPININRNDYDSISFLVVTKNHFSADLKKATMDHMLSLASPKLNRKMCLLHWLWLPFSLYYTQLRSIQNTATLQAAESHSSFHKLHVGFYT